MREIKLMKNLYAKLLNVQKEVGAITKDSTNPFFRSQYFDINGLLAELKPILNEQGLVVLQPLTNIDGRLALETLVIDEESGDQIKSIAILPENPDPQKMGSAITYFRRYALQSFFLLQAADDDAQSAKPIKAPVVHTPAYITKKDKMVDEVIEAGMDIGLEQ